MERKIVREFQLWIVCWVAGTTVLATEVAIKSRGIAETAPVLTASIPVNASPEPVAAIVAPVVPEAEIARLLVDSVIQIESRGDPRSVGANGERGLMQIKSGTWSDTTRRLYGRSIPFSRAFEPKLNRKVGTAYLAQLHEFLQENRGHWRADERSLLLACYNAGPGAVERAGFNLRKLSDSTRDYVERATALHDHFLDENAIQLKTVGRFAMQIEQIPLKRDEG
jgi:soluble lytic murein transglycosylase-like protein